MSARADRLYARTVQAVHRDSLVAQAVEHLMTLGVGPIAAALIVTWAIERAQVERRERAQWPA